MEPNLDTTNLDLTYKIRTGYKEQNPETQTENIPRYNEWITTRDREIAKDEFETDQWG